MRLWLPRLPLSAALVAVFLPLVSGTGLLVGWIGSQRMKRMLTDASQATLQARAGELRANWALRVDPRVVILDLERLSGLAGADTPAQWRAALPQFQQALERTPVVHAYYIGRSDGSLLRVSRLDRATGSRPAVMPAGSTYLLEAMNRRSRPVQQFQQVFSLGLDPLGPVPALVPPSYDPRRRPWYQLARETPGRPVLSPVQYLPLSGGMGVTLSRTLPGGGGVVAASVLVKELEQVLAKFRFTPSTQVAVVDAASRLFLEPHRSDTAEALTPLARSRSPVLAAMAPLLEQLQRQPQPLHQLPRLQSFRVNGRSWYGAVVGMPDASGLDGSYLLMAVPADELLATARHAFREAQIYTLLLVLATVPLVLLLAGWLSRAMGQLASQAARIRGFDFAPQPPVRSLLVEVSTLAAALEAMRDTIGTFLSSAAALGAEADVEQLQQRLLTDAITSSGARAGVLYRTETGDPGSRLVPCHHRGLAEQPSVAPSSQAWRDVPAPTVLRLPLHSRDQQLQGMLELHFDHPPEPARVAFCTALSGTAAVALETRSLIAAQKALFQAFIELIASSIDAKSPYTGGHCARVPELAKALAAAACEADTGPFAQFQLSSDEWEALHIAAWLHDCGKVTTPEYVVDKATKLETLYDRIHEVRMRFELLKAAAETAYWKGVAEGGDPDQLRQTLETTWQALDDDFAFVASCNQGGEAMAPEHIARLERIASRSWRRTLDDRLGVSADELRRCQLESADPGPVWEPLLADRPRHRIRRDPGQKCPDGFTLPVPELLYDRGELTNLRISRGTLSAEERYKINEHIIQTIRMLEALPFPPHLRGVPEIAGGHHERMDGRGYPRGLTREQMSPLARMMALADVFEALTAADRPYKNGKPLSVALEIMAAMVRDHHLDPDLFILFVQSGVYRGYADRFLDPAQIDAVDEQALLASVRSMGSSVPDRDP